MFREGYVSLWAGTSPDQQTLRNLLESQYDEDGEFIRPPFMDVFKISTEDRWDEDFSEIERLDAASPVLSELLRGFSYDDKVIPLFDGILGPSLPEPVDSIVLLYEYDYAGYVTAATLGSTDLRFYGVVRYK